MGVDTELPGGTGQVRRWCSEGWDATGPEPHSSVTRSEASVSNSNSHIPGRCPQRNLHPRNPSVPEKPGRWVILSGG